MKTFEVTFDFHMMCETRCLTIEAESEKDALELGGNDRTEGWVTHDLENALLRLEQVIE